MNINIEKIYNATSGQYETLSAGAVSSDDGSNLLTAGQLYNQAQLTKSIIPSGFTKVGDIDYTYMSTNPNTIKFLTESEAFVNGYRIVTPAATIITLNAPPVDIPRDDLVFLEVWLDSTTGIPQSRYRVVDGVDFSIKTTTGIPMFGQDGMDFINTWSDFNGKVTSQGGNTIPFTITSVTDNRAYKVFYNSTLRLPSSGWSSPSQQILLNDVGLYVAGSGDSTSKSTLLTLDGYSYAIPMFKIHRRPSCGFMETNEYLKISPLSTVTLTSGKTNQAKVSHTGVTGGVTTTISGKTLVNLFGNNADFETDSNSDGLADGLFTAGAGTGSLSLTTVNAVGGGKCQKINVTGGTKGFYNGAGTQVINGHKYMFSIYGLSTVLSTISFGDAIYSTNFGGLNLSTTAMSRVSKILTASSVGLLCWYYTSSSDSYIDKIMLYDLTAIYGAGNEPSDIAQLERELPFVNGVGHAQPSALKVSGKNLVNNDLTKWTCGALDVYSTFVPSITSVFTFDGANFVLNCSNVGDGVIHSLKYPIKVKPSTSYKLSINNVVVTTGVGSLYYYFYYKGVFMSLSGAIGLTAGVFSTDIAVPSNVDEVRFRIRTSTSPLSMKFTSVQLEEGSSATAYEPYMESIANLPEECADLKAIGAVKDTLDLSSGVLTENISDWKVLDGSLGWTMDSNYINFKWIAINNIIPFAPNCSGSSVLITKYNGNGIPIANHQSDSTIVLQTSMYLGIASPDTGLCDSIMPTNNELRAYFYGYKMCHSDGVSPYQVSEVPYNPSTWSEWSKPSGVIGDSTGLEITSNGVMVQSSINTTLKVLVKYGILYNVISSNLDGALHLVLGDSQDGIVSKIIGNNKSIYMAPSSFIQNRVLFYVGSDNTNGNKIKIKDIRLFELPTGSQIETDFNTLTADQLTAKYLFYGLNPKNWKKVTDGTGLTATLPTGSYKGYTPYKMCYQLATPVVTNIKEKIQGRNYYNVGYNGVEIKQVSSQMGMPIAMPNAVTNGDFSNGTTGWVGGCATISASNNIITVTGTGAAYDADLKQITTLPITVGNKVYIRTKAMVTNPSCSSLIFGIYGSTAGSYTSQVTNPQANIWYSMSGIQTLASGMGGTVCIADIWQRYVDIATQIGKVMQVQNVFCLDLTTTFGAGNEPDQAWCDKYLDFGTNFKMVSPANTTALVISNDYGSRFEGVKGNVGVIPATKYSSNKTYKLHYQKEDGSYVPPEVSIVCGTQTLALTKCASVGSVTALSGDIACKKSSDGSKLLNALFTATTPTVMTAGTIISIQTSGNTSTFNVGDYLGTNGTLYARVLSIVDNTHVTALVLTSVTGSGAYAGWINYGTRADKLLSDIIADRDIWNLRHSVSLIGWNYSSLLEESFDKLLRGEL